MHLLISVNCEVLFKSSPRMLWKALSIPKKFLHIKVSILWCFSYLNMSIFYKRRKLLQGILSISISVGNSCLSLVAALKNLSNAGSISSKLKILFMIFNPLNLPSNIFVAKNLPVCLLVRDCQCSCLSRKSKSVLLVFEFFFDHKSIYISKAWITCHIQVHVQCGNFI